MTIKQALRYGHNHLKNSDSPHLDSEVLLSFVMQKNKAFLYTHPEHTLTAKQTQQYKQYIHKRADDYPVAYITNTKSFYELDLYVDERVLIPRPETEIIIDHIRTTCTITPSTTIVDIGTGSGCVAISLARLFPDTQVIASDISKNALAVTRKNIHRHNIHNITVLHGHLWEPIKAHLTTLPEHLIIIANLPYLDDQDIKHTLRHEPSLALYATQEGRALYAELVMQLSQSIPTAQIHLFCEIDPPQYEPLAKTVQTIFPTISISQLPDLHNHTRYLTAQKLYE